MVHVKQVTVDVSVPSDVVRMVAMQPFAELSSEEPFQWLAHKVDTQLAAIRHTLDLAQNGFGGSPVNFTLFPEYSIPGAAGTTIIDDRVSSNDWPNESVIIAGVHGLTKTEYECLCDQLDVNVSPANSPDSVPNDQWVNCCLIWVKDRNGEIQRWAQPKIRPAWLEIKVACEDMFRGSTVYVFECQYTSRSYPCNFVTLVCFDWIASGVCNEVLCQLNTKWEGSPTPLHWVFVIQHNTGPNKPLFLNSTYQFLMDTNTFDCVERKEAVVIHANTAVSNRPSRSNGSGGFSACVFSPSAQVMCAGGHPTVCMEPVSLRGSDILKRCKDVVFREMGECIHVFSVRVPRFITSDATDKTYPLVCAQVHPASDVVDPRLPGGPVDAALKWVNDALDYVPRLSAKGLAGCPLTSAAEEVEESVIKSMRVFDGPAASKRIDWAACSRSHGTETRDDERRQNADRWGDVETAALEHVIHSLTSLRLTYNLDVAGSPRHATFNSNACFIQVVAIRGESHEDCRRHFDHEVPKGENDPVLVITRDRDNNRPTARENARFTEVDSGNGLKYLDYQTLSDLCRNAADTEDLRMRLDEFLPGEQTII